MRSLPRLLLVALLFFAQAWAGAHAVEHAAGKEGALPNHVCELCLAAHDLGSALPSLAVPLPLLVAQMPLAVRSLSERSAQPAPLARQRGPPTA
ncbi:MAG: hypothetical protein ACM3X0_16170 [Bacteroidota bacterium]